MHAFLGVTAHAFVNGLPVSFLLSFKSFSGSHTGQHIADALEAIIHQNNLQTKIRSIVTDNASNMKKALSLIFDVSDTSVEIDGSIDDPDLWEDDTDDSALQGFVGQCDHIPCFAHSLQLVVRDGLSCLSSARLLLAKCCKLANLLHQSSLFRTCFEEVLGSGKLIPSANETRWNSMFQQLKAVSELDQVKLNTVLVDKCHANLVLTGTELSQLRDIVKILEPFSEATDITQSEKTVTISCVVPIILLLKKHLESNITSSSLLSPFVKSLLQSLHDRFSKLYALLGIHIPTTNMQSNCLSFDSNLFLMAAALDPAYGYQWLQDHPGAASDKEALRFKISGWY
jgi:hypothetical protein